MKIKPFIVKADDYHCFNEAFNYYVQAGLSKPVLKYEEIGFLDGDYQAIFYQGKRTKAIEKIIEDLRDKMDEEAEICPTCKREYS